MWWKLKDHLGLFLQNQDYYFAFFVLKGFSKYPFIFFSISIFKFG
jgi:hypothetical protein